MNKLRFRIVKRMNPPQAIRIAEPFVFIILALAFCGIFISAIGFEPITVYFQMFKAAFFTEKGLTQTIVYSIPLMLCGLGVSIAFRMNLNNLGAEGQFAIGAIAVGGFALFGPAMPLVLKMLIGMVLGITAGAAWAFLSALPKALWNVNETIVSLMMNYVALLFLDYLCYGPWMNKEGLNLPYTATISDGLHLPNIFGTDINLGIVIALIIAAFFFWFFRRTTAGYQISVIKNSLSAAKYAGINIKKNILLVMCISGALAGMAGVVKVLGVTYRLQPALPAGAGFTAIVIAYLSKFNPFLVLLVSFLFGGLSTGSYTVQIFGVPSQIATMIQGSILLFVLMGEFFVHNKIIFTKKGVVPETLLMKGEKV